MKADLNRLRVVSLETELVVKQCARGVYIKATEKSLTTSGPIGRGLWITYQLVWSLDARTGAVSQSVHNLHHTLYKLF